MAHGHTLNHRKEGREALRVGGISRDGHVHFEGSGDVAVGWSAYEMTLLIDGQEVKDSGSQLFYCVEQTDGSWLVVRWMYNSDFRRWAEDRGPALRQARG